MRRESENDIIQAARAAISGCNWEVGRLASLWTRSFARGRGDADFAALIGLSREQITHRRTVWNRFGEERSSRPALSWSHYRAAHGWDDAAVALDWAQKTGATRDEMANYHASLTGKGTEEPATDGEPSAVEPTPERGRKRDTKPEPSAAVEPAADSVARDAVPAAPQRTADKPEPARTLTIGQILHDLREWADVADKHQRARLAEEVALAALAMTDNSARDRMPVVVALLGEMVRELPADQFPDVADVLTRWAGEFAKPTEPFQLKDGPAQQTLPSSLSAHQQVMLEWNMLGLPFKAIKGLTHKRRAALTQRFKDRIWRDSWSKALEIVKETDWTRGVNDRSWVATFDWFIRPDTVIRLMEAGVQKKSQSARSSAFEKVFSGTTASDEE